MIILSGVLVVLAIALLVAGIVAGADGVGGVEGLTLIYVSIGISIVSALCLAIGVFLRRKELFGASGAVVPARGRATKGGKKPGKASRHAQQGRGVAEPAGDLESEVGQDTVALPSQPLDVPPDSTVFVVRGRKRYHLESCRQLAGREKEELTYAEAHDEGFSPCTACLPDTALAARAAVPVGGSATVAGQFSPSMLSTPPAAIPPEPEPGESGPGESGPAESGPAESGPAVSETAVSETAEFGTSDFKTAKFETPDLDTAEHDTAELEPAGSAHSVPVGEVPADQQAADKPEEPEEPDDPAEPVDEVPADKPEEPAEPVGEEPARSPYVRILSGTKRYHRRECALIEDIGEDAEDLETLSRDEATARGCTPCLVCQPDKDSIAD